MCIKRKDAKSDLASQVKISHVEAFDALEQAKLAYSGTGPTNSQLLPYNTFDYLPDEQDI